MEDDLGRLLLSIGPCQPSIRTTRGTTTSVAVLVVAQLVVLAVDEGHTVVWAGVDLDHATLADLLQEPLRQGPRTRVSVGGQQHEQEGVHRFGGCICDFVDTHPLEVHQQQLTQGDVGVDTAFVVNRFVPAFCPRLEISVLVVEGAVWDALILCMIGVISIGYSRIITRYYLFIRISFRNNKVILGFQVKAKISYDLCRIICITCKYHRIIFVPPGILGTRVPRDLRPPLLAVGHPPPAWARPSQCCLPPTDFEGLFAFCVETMCDG